MLQYTVIVHSYQATSIYFTTTFCGNMSENDKIMLFQSIQPQFLGVSSVLFTNSLMVALKRISLLMIR